MPLIEDDLIKYSKFPDCTCLIASRYNGVKLKMDADAKAQFYFLINQAQDQSFQKAAVDRLIAMSKIFRLNEEQQHRLSNIIDNENNLNLKETNKLEQLIKQWNDIVASLTKCVNENDFTGNWRINLSKANSLIEKIPPEMIIVSNLNDILNKLCKKLVEDNGHTSEYIKSLTKPMNDMTLSSVAMLIGKALLLVNYSQSNNKDQRVEEDIREIKETMDQNNVSYCLIVYSTNREAFKKYFSDQLQSTENQNVFDACETLVFLSDCSKGDEFNSLVDIVIEHLFGGIDFETSRYVFTLNRLVKKDKISNDKIRNILKILARLNNITAYNSGNSDLIDEKINIRSSCCSLAYDLYHAKYLNAKKLPEEIEIWKSIAQDDNEFTEVRNAWNDQEYLYDISLENRKQVEI